MISSIHKHEFYTKHRNDNPTYYCRLYGEWYTHLAMLTLWYCVVTVTSHVHTVSLFVTYIEMNQIAPVRNASIVQPYTKTMQARMYAVLVVHVPFS